MRHGIKWKSTVSNTSSSECINESFWHERTDFLRAFLLSVPVGLKTEFSKAIWQLSGSVPYIFIVQSLSTGHNEFKLIKFSRGDVTNRHMAIQQHYFNVGAVSILVSWSLQQSSCFRLLIHVVGFFFLFTGVNPNIGKFYCRVYYKYLDTYLLVYIQLSKYHK